MNQVFVYWDNSSIHHEAITFREPSRPGYEFSPPRDQAALDLSRRQTA